MVSITIAAISGSICCALIFILLGIAIYQIVRNPKIKIQYGLLTILTLTAGMGLCIYGIAMFAGVL